MCRWHASASTGVRADEGIHSVSAEMLAKAGIRFQHDAMKSLRSCAKICADVRTHVTWFQKEPVMSAGHIFPTVKHVAAHSEVGGFTAKCLRRGSDGYIVEEIHG